MVCKRTFIVLQVFLLGSTATTPGFARASEPVVVDAVVGDAGQTSQEVSTRQMRQILAEGGALVVDARPHKEFVNGHIPGAFNPGGPPDSWAAALEKRVAGDKTKALVLYCNGPYCEASRRMSARLHDAGFTNIRRYQLGMPIWRALGGPTEIGIEGVLRIFKQDHTAVFFDTRSAEDYAKGSLDGARNLTRDAAAKVKGNPMPLEDFNTRIVLFGRDGAQARAVAEALSTRPWHNVSYYSGSFEELSQALAAD